MYDIEPLEIRLREAHRGSSSNDRYFGSTRRTVQTMADPRHLELIGKGVEHWNSHRPQNPRLAEAYLQEHQLDGIDLSEADLNGITLWAKSLRQATLTKATLRRSTLVHCDLRGARMDGADFGKSDLRGSDLRGADLSSADLFDADLTGADLTGACLAKANLQQASLIQTNLRNADLREVDLSSATLTSTNVDGASFTRATVHGCSAWGLYGEPADQQDLLITRIGEAPIRVDNLEVAQFIYLMIRNPRIRDALDAITQKAVLILGRFSVERKAVLDTVRIAIRARGYVPILFDFPEASTRDLTETITLLARLSRFIIADLTDPTSVPHELVSIVPHLPSVPVQPILLASVGRSYAMFEHLTRYPWVLKIHLYEDGANLLSAFDSIIEQIEAVRGERQRHVLDSTSRP